MRESYQFNGATNGLGPVTPPKPIGQIPLEMENIESYLTTLENEVTVLSGILGTISCPVPPPATTGSASGVPSSSPLASAMRSSRVRLQDLIDRVRQMKAVIDL